MVFLVIDVSSFAVCTDAIKVCKTHTCETACNGTGLLCTDRWSKVKVFPVRFTDITDAADNAALWSLAMHRRSKSEIPQRYG